jgi:thymidylate synthase ThyX
MQKFKYIRKVAEAFPYSYEDPPVCKAELWDFSRANENEEARKEAACAVASISYGNDFCKDPERLWNLLIEKGHESPFEFIRERVIDWICDVEDSFRNKDFSTHETMARNLKESTGVVVDKEFYNESLRKSLATFKLKIPIFVARQIQRHRSFSYMEMSRRYVKEDKVGFEFWKPPQVQPTTYHQEAIEEYEWRLRKGCKPEQARGSLPIEQYTQFWMQGDYRAWLNFFIYRLHPEAQEETRLVAQSMWNLLKEHQPENIKTMAGYLDEWTQDCNPIFRPARQKRAEWFKKEFLEE